MSRRSEYLLVDGYNVIFAWNDLRVAAEASLEDARIKLLDILCDYQGYKQNYVIAVFDAHQVRGGVGSVEAYNNIQVVFTKEAETADNFIERTAAALAKRDKVRVVTSDYTEQIIIMGRGAIRVSVNDFRREVETLRSDAQKRFLNKRPVKANPLMDLLDEKTAKLLEQMRRNQE
ncbi:MAG: NYN domain-containing protein [Clostridiales bacterium]|nr:NYN domain-containing protein [Clostridiales bacterium]